MKRNWMEEAARRYTVFGRKHQNDDVNEESPIYDESEKFHDYDCKDESYDEDEIYNC